MSNPKPKNATPKKLQLEPPQLPRLPFSSPMGEEVLSPTSPNSRTPPQARQRKFIAGSYDVKANTQHGLALDMPTTEKTRQRKDESPRRPGLNLVTNFPPRTSSTQKIQPNRPKNSSAKGDSNLQNESARHSGHTRQASSKSLKSATSQKNRLDVLRRTDSKTSNLSPSDRAVVIGISLPPDEVAEHAQSAISPERENGGMLGPQLTRERRASNTPSIVVTPATAMTPWPAADDESVAAPRPRARSSVYSQGPSANIVPDPSIIPPVPALPPEAKRSNLKIKTELEQGPPRVMSNCTIFDEEADSAMAGPDSAHSQLRILKKPSVDTLTTRPRSQGWWNNVMSPFWPRSPMNLKSSTLPKSSRPSPPGSHRDTLIEDEDVSPLDENSHGIKSGRTSWTDSPIEEENAKPALTFDQILPSHNHTRSITALQPNPIARDSTCIPTAFEGVGAAAEYFEACLHDMYDPTPFFPCHNHRCLPRKFEANGIRADNIDEPGSRGLGFNAPDAWEASEQVKPRDMNNIPETSNRFSSAFRKAGSPKPGVRPMSETTIIEDLDETPYVQEAHIAPIVRAPEPIPMAQPATVREAIEPEADEQPGQQAHNTPPLPPLEAYGQPRKAYRSPPSPPYPPADTPKERSQKRYVAVMPPEPPARDFEEPRSPPPPTPGPQPQAPKDALPLKPLRTEADPPRPTGNTYIINHNYNPRRSGEQTSMADFFPPPRFDAYPKRAVDDKGRGEKKSNKDKEKQTKEEWSVKESKPSRSSKLKSCCCHRRSNNKKPAEKLSKKKKRLLWLLAVGLVAMIILIVLLAMLLHRKGDGEPVQTQWLNITGYPPIPTGISTIAQPNAVEQEGKCVNVTNMWSCALPKEQQSTFTQGEPDQPNFRVEIRFENGTNATTSINSSTNTKRSDIVVNPVSAASFIRHRLLQLRSSIPSTLFNPSPAPPAQQDQSFLGNTTDGNQAPFDGEYTPFFMTFDSPTPLPSASRFAKREPTASSPTTTSSTAANTSDPFPDLASAIPNPSINQNGTASPANLYPLPSAQPLRLFDRGLSTEHYGFYTYFDRSIFLKASGLFNTSTSDSAGDEKGGSWEDEAKVRCTWTQTRFLVQIWTKKGQPYPLLPPDDGNSSGAKSNNTTTSTVGQNATSLFNSSANDLSRPGSFPYPITISLDRHGGDVKTKEIYCYGLDNNNSEKPLSNEKIIQLENRAYKGTLVNPASGPFASNQVSLTDGGPGGIDGGSGGCACRWQNWQ